MPTPTTVLIVVPTLGQRLEMLRQSVGSLLEQTHRCGIRVIAGGNVEAVRRLGDELGFAVSRQHRRGLSDAVNQGWREELSGGRYLAWLGDDDRLPRRSIETAVGLLDHDGSRVMAYGRTRFIDENGGTLFITRPGRLARWSLPYAPNRISQPGTLFRASAIEVVGGLDPTLRYTMDLDLFLRLRRYGRLVATREVLGEFRVHASSITQMFDREMAAEAEAVRRRYRRNSLPTRVPVVAATTAARFAHAVERRLPA